MRNPILVLRLFTRLARLTLDLRRLDEVIAINDLLTKLARPADMDALLADLRRSPVAAQALQSRPRLGVLDVHELASMPPETLGGAYGRFMLERDLSPTSLPSLHGRRDIDYVLTHIYESHDLWHVVTGFDTDTNGEIALQAFYLAQHSSYLALFALSAVLINTAFFSYDQKHVRLEAIVGGWRLGVRSTKLFGVDWRQRLAQPLADIRREFGLLEPTS